MPWLEGVHGGGQSQPRRKPPEHSALSPKAPLLLLRLHPLTLQESFPDLPTLPAQPRAPAPASSCQAGLSAPASLRVRGVGSISLPGSQGRGSPPSSSLVMVGSVSWTLSKEATEQDS